jgi:hypothetical protein
MGRRVLWPALATTLGAENAGTRTLTTGRVLELGVTALTITAYALGVADAARHPG